MKKKIRKISVPGDKSITHRAIIIGSLARGKTRIINPLVCDDTMSTVSAMRSLGITVLKEEKSLTVLGHGINGLKKPSYIIDCGNSATTMRLLMGILSGQEFDSYLTGDESLMKRPMDRVIIPLSQMGALITREGNAYHISGRKLHSINYTMPVSSAQVKSAIMLADLFAERNSVINDPGKSRNHTELMLDYFGKTLKGKKIIIPGDISSAAYHIAETLISPGAEIIIKNVGINETRTGFIDVIRSMGAQVQIKNKKSFANEPVADIHVRNSALYGTSIKNPVIPRVIDEIPLLAVLAAFAEGKTEIRDSSELRLKESDRINSVIQGLKSIGVNVSERADGMDITGTMPEDMQAAEIDSYADHRIAMSFLILTHIIPGLKVKNKECVAVSYPTFFKDFHI
ncbi:MAG: 3-phosphoshikimate 1-carboxyvinyltransferase [Lachnospiraceae bacterium]|nr:3-phosphoshikimate 1-carboxyvinyltransferase [Lachnospiraceae bacterium]